MPLPNDRYTSKDYWNLPTGQRAELIDGQLYNMAPPSRKHQRVSGQLYKSIVNFIDAHNGSCEVYAAPFAVNLDANDATWVEPDISVICDKDKLTDRGCCGAPDFIVEIVSPSSRSMDYITKTGLYRNAGVKEYWIADPTKDITVVYLFDGEDITPAIFPFSAPISIGRFAELNLVLSNLL